MISPSDVFTSSPMITLSCRRRQLLDDEGALDLVVVGHGDAVDALAHAGVDVGVAG